MGCSLITLLTFDINPFTVVNDVCQKEGRMPGTVQLSENRMSDVLPLFLA